MTPFFTDQRFKLKAPGAVHGFFGRQGGVSHGLYESLNCGYGSDDDPESVRENRRRVAEALGLSDLNLLSLHQIHSPECEKVTTPWLEHEKPQADAFVTDKPGVGLGILTADCVPVLFYAEKAGGGAVIGAAHAGWKGALGGVLSATVNAMNAYHIKPETLCAAIGPAIGPESYEVDSGFKLKFEENNITYSKYFIKTDKEDKYLCDLPQFCADRMKELGVAFVYNKNLDTFYHEDDFFSYRRATHRKDKDYGRQISMIAIKENT